MRENLQRAVEFHPDHPNFALVLRSSVRSGGTIAEGCFEAVANRSEFLHQRPRGRRKRYHNRARWLVSMTAATTDNELSGDVRASREAGLRGRAVGDQGNTNDCPLDGQARARSCQLLGV